MSSRSKFRGPRSPRPSSARTEEPADPSAEAATTIASLYRWFLTTSLAALPFLFLVLKSLALARGDSFVARLIVLHTSLPEFYVALMLHFLATGAALSMLGVAAFVHFRLAPPTPERTALVRRRWMAAIFGCLAVSVLLSYSNRLSVILIGVALFSVGNISQTPHPEKNPRAFTLAQDAGTAISVIILIVLAFSTFSWLPWERITISESQTQPPSVQVVQVLTMDDHDLTYLSPKGVPVMVNLDQVKSRVPCSALDLGKTAYGSSDSITAPLLTRLLGATPQNSGCS
ncbi:hypothetical protein [Kineosporia sp. NBRC 101731]|uniref:hypothetical protein n=1 Tax=Kineosporia sp. NBRC 101731 TaxID=3032199 RepID=UPI0024A1EC1A|nr:hypothetical protein [Kineosporia sp. NBRC 101731]GLY28129.1 hypothetical protein Kisp02_14940 [Kineosporia sp. NBRC 101731]